MCFEPHAFVRLQQREILHTLRTVEFLIHSVSVIINVIRHPWVCNQLAQQESGSFNPLATLLPCSQRALNPPYDANQKLCTQAC